MKKILISIRPEWVVKILNGEKTVEVRKTAPKCDFPCEVYIYCTKGKKDERLARTEIDGVGNYKTQTSNHNIKETRYFFGKDIPSQATEYIKNKYKGRYTNFLTMRSNGCNGLVVAKFTLNKVDELAIVPPGDYLYSIKVNEQVSVHQECWIHKACLTNIDLLDYLKKKNGYAWHIDDLVIFDKPKELKDYGVKCSPQSWCYCEVEG